MPKTARSIKILNWNARIVLNNKSEITHLHSHNVDVECIFETYLKPAHSFRIRNYSVSRNDRPTLGGGKAILI